RTGHAEARHPRRDRPLGQYRARSPLSRNASGPQSSYTVRVTDSGRKRSREPDPAVRAGDDGECSVVCLGDALDDCQAKADTCMVPAYAFRAALKRLGKRGNQLWSELLAGVLDN